MRIKHKRSDTKKQKKRLLWSKKVPEKIHEIEMYELTDTS